MNGQYDLVREREMVLRDMGYIYNICPRASSSHFSDRDPSKSEKCGQGKMAMKIVARRLLKFPKLLQDDVDVAK